MWAIDPDSLIYSTKDKSVSCIIENAFPLVLFINMVLKSFLKYY